MSLHPLTPLDPRTICKMLLVASFVYFPFQAGCACPRLLVADWLRLCARVAGGRGARGDGHLSGWVCACRQDGQCDGPGRHGTQHHLSLHHCHCRLVYRSETCS